MVANTDVRKAIWLAKEQGIKQYEVAEAIGVSEPTLTRWLRKEMSDDKKKLITEAVKNLRRRKV
jgi:transcriptional regulator with XRE-family HTH domain